MAISLVQGQNAPLTGGLSRILVGLGWDPRSDGGPKFDLDASCFLLGENGFVRSQRDLVFYGQTQSACGSVVYGGDNRDGVGDGDDETFDVDLTRLPADVAKLLFVVTIYKAGERKQNFGMVDSAFIRVVDQTTGEELVRFDLTEDACREKALIFGELYQRDGAWKFRALGEGYESGDPDCRHELQALARRYGVY
ncbi:MAG: TerD family protein [Thermoguttaceae bacterium]|nr:TerD family protein [Thermoguttaceae bacterium]MBQ9126705.1 TerD family protein [Thermoguttaceae bacterium]